MCAVLGVSRSGFYAWRQRPPSDREQADAALTTRIRLAHRDSRGTYGAPRVLRALRAAGTPCGKHRVARLMQREGLRGRAKTRFRFTSTVRAEMPAAPNRLNRDFTTPAPNPVVLDLFSRRIVGWTTAARPEQALAVEALQQAIHSRRPAAGLLHHSDRGGQYASANYQDVLDRHGMICSMSRPGNCLDNAVVESFFHTLKTEWLYHYRFRTRAQARLSIFDYIEGFYNRTRLHSALGYRSPEQHEILSSVA